MKIVVVDDFYKDPLKVRELALKSHFRDVVGLNYPGYQTDKAFTSQTVINEFEKVLGRSLDVDPKKLTFGRFRIMLESTGSRLKVHADDQCDWAGVLYLNLPQQCLGGTGFYRHKKTALEGPISDKEAQKLGFENWQTLEEDIINQDTLNSEAWEQTDYVGMRFNRLVLFKGNELFHCHTHAFGTDWENGRLTQNFFFNEKAGSND